MHPDWVMQKNTEWYREELRRAMERERFAQSFKKQYPPRFHRLMVWLGTILVSAGEYLQKQNTPVVAQLKPEVQPE